MLWAIDAQVFQQIGTAANVPADFEASTNPVLTTHDGVAVINISGVLTPEPDRLLAFFTGNTAYSDIQAAIGQAEVDKHVREVVYKINSPGGMVAGMFETMDAMRALSKPSRVEASLAASAAYALATQGGQITATGRTATFGSIGVVQRHYVDPSVVKVTSSAAPNKAPDPTTEEGAAAIRAELDELHDLMVEGIAAGRGTTPKKVNSEMGRGGVFLADKALSAGMIDAIKTPQTTKPTTKKAADMTLAELMAQHPAVYAAAVQVGTTQERDRVVAHLTLGEAAGAMATAVEAITSGADMTATYSAKYQAAAINRQAQAARIEGSQAVDETTPAAAAAAAASANGAANAETPEAKAAAVHKAAMVRAAEILGLEVH